MSERLLTRDLAGLLAGQTKLDKKRAEMFLYAVSAYVVQCIETRKAVKVNGLGTFKIVLVRERESVHIQTGEHFVIPAHHRLSFIPDKEFKDYINQAHIHHEDRFGIQSRHAIPEILYEYEDYMDETINQLLAPNANETYSIPELDKRVRDEVVERESFVAEKEIKDVVEAVVVVDNDDESVEIEDLAEIETVSLTPAAQTFNEPETQDNDSEPDTEDVYNFNDELYYQQIAEIKEPHPEYYDKPAASTQQTVVATATKDAVVAEPDAGEADKAKKTATQIAAARKFAGLFVFPSLHKQTSGTTADGDGPPKKPIIVPLWLWFVLLPVLIIAGIGAGTYAFLHWNANGGVKDLSTVSSNALEHFAVADTMYVDMIPSNADSAYATPIEDIMNSENPLAGKQDTAAAQISSQEKNEPINWFDAPSQKSKPEPKRADRESNRSSAQATSRTADKPKTETGKKTFPARIRVSAGANLYRIAEEYYGNMYFWVYIYEHNKQRIPDYTRIPVGTEIYLPVPKNYSIDANNPASVEKAKKKAAEISKKNK